MTPRIVVLDEMGPVGDQVLTFMREVCAPRPAEHVVPHAHETAPTCSWAVTGA